MDCQKKELTPILPDLFVGKSIIKNYLNINRSVAYLAPEMLRRAGHNRNVDWYLFGVLIYEMVVGTPPYFNSNKEKLFENIEKGDLKVPKSFSIELKSIIIEVNLNIWTIYKY